LKERKSRESNRICRKNKEILGESKNNIKKSLEEKNKQIKSKRVKEERQSDTEYKEFDVQRKASKKTGKLIYWSIYY